MTMKKENRYRFSSVLFPYQSMERSISSMALNIRGKSRQIKLHKSDKGMTTARSRVILVSVILLLFTGCLPIWSGVFLNATDQQLRITLIDTSNREVVTEFQLPPRGRHKADVTLAHLQAVVSDATGRKLFDQPFSTGIPADRYAKFYDPFLRGVVIYFLATKQGLYPIPWEYRNNWQEHLDAIIGQWK